MTETAPASVDAVRDSLEAWAASVSDHVGGELAKMVFRRGKLLRARFTLLMASILEVERSNAEAVAQAVELVHNASLLHDDVVDGGFLRRGSSTPNALFGDSVALLLGDLAFAEASERMHRVDAQIERELMRAVREMTVGELQEEFLRGSLAIDPDAYMEVISRKTGALFVWAAGALSALAERPHRGPDVIRVAEIAGLLLQLVDDIGDYIWDPAVSGKAGGEDGAARRVTLPLLVALDDPELRPQVEAIWNEEDDAEREKKLAVLIKEGRCLKRARARVAELLDEAVDKIWRFPKSPERDAVERFLRDMARRER